MHRTTKFLSLATLVVIALTFCAACAAKLNDPSVSKGGTWALSTFEGKSAPYSYASSEYKFDYNERGQIVESRKSTNAANIVSGRRLKCTWAEDGLSYKCSYTLTGGNVGEKSDSGTSEATFQVEYKEHSASYAAHGERILNFWESGDSSVRYSLEYRTDGTIKHKEVEGRESEGNLEVFDYDDHGNLVRYELTSSKEEKPLTIRTYDITYENDVPKSVTVTAAYPAADDEKADNTGSEDADATGPRVYELGLHADDKGNIVSVDYDGRKMATMSWVYLENPDSLSRLRAQAEAASALELL